MRNLTVFRGGETFEYKLKDEASVIELGEAFAKTLPGGAVVGLNGDLGSGKTTFTKGIAKGFGVTEVVASPTFVIMKTYPTTEREGITTFCHIDAYRLKSAKDLEAVGAQDYIGKPSVVTVVEWPGNVSDALPEDIIQMMFVIPPAA